MANQVEKITVDVALEAGKVDVAAVQAAIDKALASLAGSKSVKVDIEFVGGDLTTLLKQLESLKEASASVTKTQAKEIDATIAKAAKLEKVLNSSAKVVNIPPAATERFDKGSAPGEALATRVAETSKYENILRSVISLNEASLKLEKLEAEEEAAINKALHEQEATLKTVIELRQKLKGTADSTLPGISADTIAVANLENKIRSLEVELAKLHQTAPGRTDSSYLGFLNTAIKKTEELMRAQAAVGQLPSFNLQSSLSGLKSDKSDLIAENKVTALKSKIEDTINSIHVLNTEAAKADTVISVESRQKQFKALSDQLEKQFLNLQKFNQGVNFLQTSVGKTLEATAKSIITGEAQTQAIASQLNTVAKLEAEANNTVNRLANQKVTSGNQKGFINQLDSLIQKVKDFNNLQVTPDPKLAKVIQQLEASKNTVLSVKLQVTDLETVNKELDRIKTLKASIGALGQTGDISLKEQASVYKQIANDLDKLAIKSETLRKSGAISDTEHKATIQQVKDLREVAQLRADEIRLIEKVNSASARAGAPEEGTLARVRAIRQEILAHKELEKVQARLQSLGLNTTGVATSLQATQSKLAGLNQELEKNEGFLQRSFNAFIRYAVIYKGLTAVQGAATGAVAEVVNLEKEFVNIKAIAQATNNQMLEVATTVLEVGEKSKFTTVEIAQATTTLVQAGIKLESLGAILKSVEQLAAATGAGIQETTNLTTTFLAVFKDANPLDIADSLKSAVNISKLNVQDLNTISNYLLSTGKSFNEDFKDILAVSATLKNAGLKASTIATNSRQALLELLSPDEKALKGLSARYAAIGEKTSQEAVAAIFRSFKAAKDPLSAALGELQRLGIGGLGSEQLSRIFDVRSENVIKTLVQNKEALTANRVLLDDAGSAAQGAKVQMESLATSLQNLQEVLQGGLYDASNSSVKELGLAVRDITESVKDLIHQMDELKKRTGSTGLGSSLKSGAIAGVATGVRTGSLLKGVVVGVGTTVAQEAASLNGEEGTANAISTATNVVGILAGLKFVFDKLKALAAKLKPAANFGTLAQNTANGVTSSAGVVSRITAFFSGITSFSGLMARFGVVLSGLGAALLANPVGLAVTAVALATAAVYKLYDMVPKPPDIKAIEATANGRLEAAQKLYQEEKNKIDELKTQLEQKKQQKDVTADFGKKIEAFDAAVITALDNSQLFLDDINKALEEAASVSSQIGSQSLKEFAEKVGVSNQRVAADLVQTTNETVAIAEAFRQQAVQRKHLAVSRIQEGNALSTDAASVAAFNALSEEEKATLQTPVLTASGIKKIYEIKRKLEKGLNLNNTAELEQEIEDRNAKLAADGADKVKILVEQWQKSGVPSVATKIKDMVAEAVESGSVEIVKAMVAASKGIVQPQAIAEAEKIARTKAVAQFNTQVKTFNESDAASRALQPLGSLSSGNVTSKVRQDITGVEQKLASQRVVYQGLLAQGQDLSKQEGSTKDLEVINEKLKSLGEEIIQKTGQLKQLKDSEVERAVSAEALDRSLILNNQKIADATHRLKIIQDSKTASAEQEVKIILEINALKKRALDAEKLQLAKQIGLILRRDENIDVGKATPEQILKELSSKKGQELVTNSADLANAYKSLLTVTDKEVNLREEALKDLSNVAASAEKKKLAQQQHELTKVNHKLSQQEAELQKATEDLTNARQNLADALKQQQDVEQFFSGLSSSGNDKQNLRDLGSQAFFDPTNIELQKTLASAASEALRGNQISQFEAQGIIDEARQRARDAAAANVDAAQSGVIQAQNRQSAAFDAAKATFETQQRLIQSNDDLSLHIDNLANTLQSTVESLKSLGQPLTPQDIQNLSAKPDLSNVQPGQPAAQAPKIPVNFSFGDTSIPVYASQWEVDRFAQQMDIRDRQKSLK